MADWDHKDEWRKRGKNFLVTITRHNEAAHEDRDEGPNRWAVYAYIYPKHPHFAKFEGDQLFQQAATDMPLHGYPSFITRHRDHTKGGEVCSVQVGADYHHLHDSHFTHYATPEEAAEVFADAERLFGWLEEREPAAPIQRPGDHL
jgi:hypothetical protein